MVNIARGAVLVLVHIVVECPQSVSAKQTVGGGRWTRYEYLDWDICTVR